MPEFSATNPDTWYPNRQAEDAASGWYPSRSRADMTKDENSGEWVSNILGRFQFHDILDIQKSKAADREIYRTIPICLEKIRGAVPEDISSSKITQHNCESFIKRFPEAWLDFQGEKVVAEGTPITDVDGIDKERAMFLSFDGIRTAEDLATFTDEQCSAKGFGWRQYRDAARDLVGAKPTEESKNSEELNALQAQVAEMTLQLAGKDGEKATVPTNEVIQALQDQNANLQSQLTELMELVTAANKPAAETQDPPAVDAPGEDENTKPARKSSTKAKEKDSVDA